MRILIVDDSTTMRTLTARMLKNIGYTDIFQCGSPLVALQKIKDEIFDLVLLDWHMPQMEGIDVLRNIRQTLKKTMPVMMLTSEQGKDNVALAIKTGADDYIIKPLQQYKLVMKINKIREKRGWGAAPTPGNTPIPAGEERTESAVDSAGETETAEVDQTRTTQDDEITV